MYRTEFRKVKRFHELFPDEEEAHEYKMQPKSTSKASYNNKWDHVHSCDDATDDNRKERNGKAHPVGDWSSLNPFKDWSCSFNRFKDRCCSSSSSNNNSPFKDWRPSSSSNNTINQVKNWSSSSSSRDDWKKKLSTFATLRCLTLFNAILITTNLVIYNSAIFSDALKPERWIAFPDKVMNFVPTSDKLFGGGLVFDTFGKNSSGARDVVPKKTKKKKIMNLPRAIIHVGPRETGDTVIHEFLIKHAAAFEEETGRYIVLGALYKDADAAFYLSKCLIFDDKYSNDDTCRQSPLPFDLLKDIEEARQLKKNIIFSSPYMDELRQVDPVKLSNLFHGFEVHIVIGYRRYFDWIESYFPVYYQFMAQDDWNSLPPESNLLDFLSSKHLQQVYNSIYTVPVYRFYKQREDLGFKITLLNYHQGNHNYTDAHEANLDGYYTILRAMFCHEIINATYACNAISQGKELLDAVKFQNYDRAMSTVYDEIAAAAYKAGLIDGSKLSRHQARDRIQDHIEKAQVLALKSLETPPTIPRRCISDEVFESLKQLSLEAEEECFPDSFNATSTLTPEAGIGKDDLVATMEKHKNTKLCSIDTDQMLNDPAMKFIFSSLQG